MIIRAWHGWTEQKNADFYQDLLKREVLPGIQANSSGCEGVHVLRRDDGDRVEFVTLMLWRSLDSIRSWLGKDYEVAYVPAEAQEVLTTYDKRSTHYDLVLTVGWDSGS